jgi:hypothetical protein
MRSDSRKSDKLHAAAVEPEFARDARREFYNNRGIVVGDRKVDGRSLPRAIPEEGLVCGTGGIA